MHISKVPILAQDQKDPTQWILVRDFKFNRDSIELIIPKGFKTDFASVPRLFWNIISPTELGDIGPIKHDWTYRTGYGTRLEADNIFLDDMKADGIAYWKRYSAYWAVRSAGWASWKKNKIEIVEVEE